MQDAWRELPETGVDRSHILGVLRLALIPLRGTRAALRMTSPKTFFEEIDFPELVEIKLTHYFRSFFH